MSDILYQSIETSTRRYIFKEANYYYLLTEMNNRTAVVVSV